MNSLGTVLTGIGLGLMVLGIAELSLTLSPLLRRFLIGLILFLAGISLWMIADNRTR